MSPSAQDPRLALQVGESCQLPAPLMAAMVERSFSLEGPLLALEQEVASRSPQGEVRPELAVTSPSMVVIQTLARVVA